MAQNARLEAENAKLLGRSGCAEGLLATAQVELAELKTKYSREIEAKERHPFYDEVQKIKEYKSLDLWLRTNNPIAKEADKANEAVKEVIREKSAGTKIYRNRGDESVKVEVEFFFDTEAKHSIAKIRDGARKFEMAGSLFDLLFEPDEPTSDWLLWHDYARTVTHDYGDVCEATIGFERWLRANGHLKG